jgi:hypothetical protein
MSSLRRFISLWLVSGLLLPAIPAFAQFGSRGISIPSRDYAKDTVNNSPVHSKYPLAHLFRLDVRDGTLSAELLAEFAGQYEAYRVEVEGSEALWTVRKRIIGGNNTVFVQISRYDFDAPADQYWCTSMTLRSGMITLLASTGDSNAGMRVRLTQANGMMSFSVGKVEDGLQTSVLLASAPTLDQLKAEHPREGRQYLSPILRNLTGGRTPLQPAPADVYRAFDSIRPDPKVVKQIEDLLARLDSEVYSVRDAASRELAGLGPPVVLALLRRDMDDLSAEARNRVERFIASRASLSPEEAIAARKDRAFLIDCLEDEDLAVRNGAKAALEKLIGRRVEFDATLTGDARSDAIDALRQKLNPQAGAATRPAATRSVR